jgi:flagellar hook protein FlgE
MYSGVSGLKAHQTKLDVIANNISNVNTVAFKSSDVNFQAVLSQTLANAQPSISSGTGGTNPSQVGLGTSIGTITTNHSTGNIETTESITDLALDGSGYFVVSDGLNTSYTRAGNFTIDSAGSLVTADGETVMGWNKDGDDNIDTSTPVESLDLSNLSMDADPTTSIEFEGNLNSDSDSSEPFEYSISVYDSLGQDHTITITFTKVDGANEFDYEMTTDDTDVSSLSGETGTVAFTSDGVLDTTNTSTSDFTISISSGASDIEITADNLIFSEDKFTQYGNDSSISGSQDGYAAGSLTGIGIDQSGNVVGSFSNGRDQTVATIAVASFINPQGLESAGGNLYTTSWNSGDPQIGIAGANSTGTISSYSLEMSNVDLASEFTEMIVAQRGFSANSKIITTSDELLQELVNLKR